jgi:hypothetical protein
LKERFLREQREWVEVEGNVAKSEALDEDETKPDKKSGKRLKIET